MDLRQEDFTGKGRFFVVRDSSLVTRAVPGRVPVAVGDRFGDVSKCKHLPFFCAEIGQGYVLTDCGWILTQDRRLLLESLADEAFYKKRRIQDRWLWPRVRLFDEKVVIAHPHWAVNNYYHWLLEFLPRLAPVVDPDVSSLALEWRNFRVVVPPHLQPWMHETLRILGLSNGSLLPTMGEQLQCDRLLFCSRLGRPMNTPHWAIDWLRLRFLKDPLSEPKRFRRIFISRRNAVKRRLVNEGEIEALLQSEGFETVVLEGMSVIDQARLFAEAQFIVAPHGAGLANVVFSQNAKVLEIFEPSWIWPTFCALSLDCNNDYHCVVGRTVAGVHIHITPDEVRQGLQVLN